MTTNKWENLLLKKELNWLNFISIDKDQQKRRINARKIVS